MPHVPVPVRVSEAAHFDEVRVIVGMALGAIPAETRLACAGKKPKVASQDWEAAQKAMAESIVEQLQKHFDIVRKDWRTGLAPAPTRRMWPGGEA